MQDPGDDLRKVLHFRKRTIAEKTILFREFSDRQDLEKQVRKCLSAYVNKVRAAEASLQTQENRTRPPDTQPNPQMGEQEGPPSSLFSPEGFAFLEKFLDRARRESKPSLSTADVARLRLLANSISAEGNQELSLGIHDINALFLARIGGLELSNREVSCLVKLGFQHLDHENVPLWRWYADSNSPAGTAFVSSMWSSNEDEKIGALRVLTQLGLRFPKDEDWKQRILQSWFSEDSSVRVRSAALEYLAKVGSAVDYTVAEEEYGRGDSGTSRAALECMVAIRLRTRNLELSQHLVLESQFESLNPKLLRAVLVDFENLETSVLLPGLEHRNPHVRLHTLTILLQRGSITTEMLERLTGDSDATVRNAVVDALTKLGESPTESAVRAILVRPRHRPGLLVTDTDAEGERFFAQYQLDRLAKAPHQELTRLVAESLIFQDTAYFARAERYFQKCATDLRRDVDDTFEVYFAERLERMETFYRDCAPAEDFAKHRNEYLEIEQFYRKKLTRRGLDILCRAGDPNDLYRIRHSLEEGYVGASGEDARYLAMCGDWADIMLLSTAEASIAGYQGGSVNSDFRREVARSVLKLSRRRQVSSLFSLEIPAATLEKIIELCPDSRFSKISSEALMDLLDHESVAVRKAASIKAVRTFTRKRLKVTLDQYVNRDLFRYYNVIHWLDLGVSMARAEVVKIARAVQS